MKYELIHDNRDGIDRIVARKQARPPKGLEGEISRELDCVDRIMDGFVVDDVEAFIEYIESRDIAVTDAR